MSEHKHNTSRYWRRQEPNSQDVVYFITESNAAHSRAESDSHASEISQSEYNTWVPMEARDAPFNATTGERHLDNQPKPANDLTAIVEQYKAQCAATMMNIHHNIVTMLLNAPITHAERVFVLEMIKAELTQSLMQQPAPTHH